MNVFRPFWEVVLAWPKPIVYGAVLNSLDHTSGAFEMLSATDTAYPLLKPNPSDRELNDVFTPTRRELAFAEERTKEPAPCVGLLLLLKTFQRLGYFVRLEEIPKSIVRQVSKAAGFEEIPDGLAAYDASTARYRHMVLVRSWLGVTPFDRNARRVMVEASVQASRVREDLADIINTAIEELVRQRFELPAFSAIMRAARTARATVNAVTIAGLLMRSEMPPSSGSRHCWSASRPNIVRVGIRSRQSPANPPSSESSVLSLTSIG